MEVNIIKYHFRITLFEYGIDMIERLQCGEDGGSGAGTGCRVIPCDNNRRDLSDTKTFELSETKTDGAVGGVRAVKEISRVDHVIGICLEYRIDYLGKGIVKICFALVDTGFIEYLKIVKS